MAIKDYKALKPIQQKFIKTIVLIKVLVLVLGIAALWYFVRVMR